MTKRSSHASRHRILQVITPSRMAGAETLLTRLVPRLEGRGHQVRVTCNTGSAGLGEFRCALQRGGHDVAALPIGGKSNPRAALVLWRAARRSGSEFTHSHLSTASWWCGWLERAGALPSLGHVHGFTSAHWHRRQRFLVACSGAVKEHLVGQGIAPGRITVLPNPVDEADLRPTRTPELVRAEMGAGPRTPVIGSFGHLSEKKGWRDLLAAMPDVLRVRPDAQFWCAGAGPLRAELEARAQAGGFGRSVRFLGFRRDVADLMNAIDLMALPSHQEPFGLVYVEAALMGKPCVGCHAGGTPDVVRDGLTGLLVPPHDPTALAGAIVALLDDRAQAARMGAAGRERVLDCFNWPRFLHGLETVYDAVAAARC